MQFVFGKHVVKELLQDQGRIQHLYVIDSWKDQDLLQASKQQGIPVTSCGKKKLDQFANQGNHQGIVAEIKDYETISLEELINRPIKGEFPLYIMLDGIKDPQNLGAILRSADAVNADGVIIAKHGSVGITPTVAKVSTGAVRYIPVAEVTNLSKTLQRLQKDGFWVVGTALDETAQDYRSVDYCMALVLVIGNEGDGISPLVLRNCDFKVYLPMSGHVQSLNASVATGICLYEIQNQRERHS